MLKMPIKREVCAFAPGGGQGTRVCASCSTRNAARSVPCPDSFGQSRAGSRTRRKGIKLDPQPACSGWKLQRGESVPGALKNVNCSLGFARRGP